MSQDDASACCRSFPLWAICIAMNFVVAYCLKLTVIVLFLRRSTEEIAGDWDANRNSELV